MVTNINTSGDSGPKDRRKTPVTKAKTTLVGQAPNATHAGPTVDINPTNPKCTRESTTHKAPKGLKGY